MRISAKFDVDLCVAFLPLGLEGFCQCLGSGSWKDLVNAILFINCLYQVVTLYMVLSTQEDRKNTKMPSRAGEMFKIAKTR